MRTYQENVQDNVRRLARTGNYPTYVVPAEPEGLGLGSITIDSCGCCHNPLSRNETKSAEVNNIALCDDCKAEIAVEKLRSHGGVK